MLLNPINLKDTLNFSCFQAKDHIVEFMTADPSAIYLATGCGEDVRIWKGGKHCMSLPISLLYAVDSRHIF